MKGFLKPKIYKTAYYGKFTMVSRFCFGGNVPYSYTEIHVLQDYNMENEVLNILPTVADDVVLFALRRVVLLRSGIC